MTPDNLYFYVDGSDLHEVAPLLRQRLSDFLESRTWVSGEAWLVDQVHEGAEGLKPGDLPDWDLGLNLQLRMPPESRPAHWFDDVSAIVTLLHALSVETERSFVVGGSCDDASQVEDFFAVDERPIDLDRMRRQLGG
jgi:hypothetical protein